jgi:ADP-ribose pyrophosphatase
MANPEFQREIVSVPGMRFRTRMAIDHFRLPNNEMGRWESFYHAEVTTVYVAAFTTKGKILIVRMFRFPVEDWIFELPGGDTKPGEEPAETARRELLEETGYSTSEDFLPIGGGPLFPGGINARFLVFSAKNCKKTQKPQLDEVEKLAGLEAAEIYPVQILEELRTGSLMNIDPALSHALLCLKATYS